MTNSGPGPANRGDATQVMPGHSVEPSSPAPDGPRHRPRRWYEKPAGAVFAGGLVGLGIAAVVALLLVIFVPSDDDADAGADPDATPTEDAGGEPTPSPVDFAGTWVTNFAVMDLQQQGTSVTGEYSRFLADNSPRTLKGVITGRTLEGTFDGEVNPFRFQLANDGRSFSGHWADPQGGLHEWCGSIDTPLPDGCGYSGEWRVKDFPREAVLEGDTILMSQYGDSVRMRFDSATHGEVEFDLAFDGTTLARASGPVQLGNIELTFQFLVTEDPDWQTLRGQWVSPASRGNWCAAQGDAALPC